MPSRASKRQKLESDPAIDPKHAAFTDWARQRDIEIDRVEPAALPGRGIGLMTTKKIKKDDQIIHVPAEAMIKPQTDLYKIADDKTASISPQARLAATLMHMDSTKDDEYETCSSVWPTSDDFESSLFWYSLTAHTASPPWYDSMPATLRTASTRLMQDFRRDLLSVQELEHESFKNVTAQSFVYFWTIANTRSFAWKPHGRREGVMVMCPFLDYMNHCPSGEGCGVSMSEEGYTLTANRDYEIGEEILATYGAHSNDKLLVHYGFTMPGSADDSIQLDSIILPSLNDAQKSDLENVGYLGNYSFFPSTEEICFRTQVALRSKSMTSNEWEYFMNSGDDIGVDMDEEIKSDLATFIESTAYRRQLDLSSLQLAADHASKPTFRAAMEQVIQRAIQINSALASFQTSHSSRQ